LEILLEIYWRFIGDLLEVFGDFIGGLCKFGEIFREKFNPLNRF